MKKIALTQGKFATVDDEDFEWLNQWKWYFAKGYAVRQRNTLNGQRMVYMHKEVSKPKHGLVADHISTDKLDNRRKNLRNCTKGEDSRNKHILKSNSTGFKGVYFKKQSRKFVAQIAFNACGQKHLGYFDTAREAGAAYAEAAKELHGEFARIN